MLRLALICDFPEERWPSMDLVGDMLLDQVSRRYGTMISTERIRPAFRRRATATWPLRASRPAWNGDRLWNRMVGYPRFLEGKRSSFDLFHIVDHSYAHLALGLQPGRTVITCHDLDAFRCLTDPATEPRPYWFRFMARRILRGLQSAAHVIFVSESVRREAISLGLVDEHRCSVIHNGVHAESEICGEAGGHQVMQLLPTGGDGRALPGPILLSVGSTVPRKRIDILLRTFANVLAKYPTAKLVRVGGPLTTSQSALARESGTAQSIVELPFVDRSVLSAVYRRATVLLQPSDSEGFGLPVAEAMACGCPVVASDIPALREVGGDGAVYCQPGDVTSWTSSVLDLLNQWTCTPSAREEFRHRAIRSARRFGWASTADRVVDVYRQVVANG